MGHTGGVIYPRPWRRRCRASYSNTGGPPLPRKRGALSKKAKKLRLTIPKLFFFPWQTGNEFSTLTVPKGESGQFNPKCLHHNVRSLPARIQASVFIFPGKFIHLFVMHVILSGFPVYFLLNSWLVSPSSLHLAFSSSDLRI